MSLMTIANWHSMVALPTDTIVPFPGTGTALPLVVLFAVAAGLALCALRTPTHRRCRVPVAR